MGKEGQGDLRKKTMANYYGREMEETTEMLYKKKN